MTPEQRNQIRDKIQRSLAKTKEDIEYLLEVTKPIPPENSIGRLSRMDAINNKSVNVAALANSRNKLADLNLAISKVELDDYGLCATCREPIQFERLMFRPESTKCVNCARK